MTLAAAANKAPTIKPGDLIRTSEGATGTVLEIAVGGYRQVQLLKGGIVRLHVSQLYLVRASTVNPWPSYRE